MSQRTPRPWGPTILSVLVLSSSFVLIVWGIQFIFISGLSMYSAEVATRWQALLHGWLFYPTQYGLVSAPLLLSGVLLWTSSYGLVRLRMWAWWLAFAAILTILPGLLILWGLPPTGIQFTPVWVRDVLPDTAILVRGFDWRPYEGLVTLLLVATFLWLLLLSGAFRRANPPRATTSPRPAAITILAACTLLAGETISASAISSFFDAYVYQSVPGGDIGVFFLTGMLYGVLAAVLVVAAASVTLRLPGARWIVIGASLASFASGAYRVIQPPSLAVLQAFGYARWLAIQAWLTVILGGLVFVYTLVVFRQFRRSATEPTVGKPTPSTRSARLVWRRMGQVFRWARDRLPKITQPVGLMLLGASLIAANLILAFLANYPLMGYYSYYPSLVIYIIPYGPTIGGATLFIPGVIARIQGARRRPPLDEITSPQMRL